MVLIIGNYGAIYLNFHYLPLRKSFRGCPQKTSTVEGKGLSSVREG